MQSLAASIERTRALQGIVSLSRKMSLKMTCLPSEAVGSQDLPHSQKTLRRWVQFINQGILVFSLISPEMLIGMSFHCTDHSKLEEETCDKMATGYFVLIY